jgi:hypothetical protein
VIATRQRGERQNNDARSSHGPSTIGYPSNAVSVAADQDVIEFGDTPGIIGRHVVKGSVVV